MQGLVVPAMQFVKPIIMLFCCTFLMCSTSGQKRQPRETSSVYNEAERAAMSQCFGDEARPCEGRRYLDAGFRDAIRRRDQVAIDAHCNRAREREGATMLQTGCAAF